MRRHQICMCLGLVLAALCPGAANGDAPGPGWAVTGRAYPTNIAPGSSGYVDLQIFNVGAADSNGSVTVTDTLPAGLEATNAGELGSEGDLAVQQTIEHRLWHCAGATVVRCVSDPLRMPAIAGGAGGSGGTGPNFTPQIAIAVTARAGAAEHEVNDVTIAGGGAATPASATESITVSSASPPFGIADWDVWFSNADGTFDTQAGSHPYAATFSFDLNTVLAPGKEYDTSGGIVRNVEVRLPPGFVGNPTAVPQCTIQQFDSEASCPAATQVGFIDAVIFGRNPVRLQVYNLVPPPGMPAQFGFKLHGVNTFLNSSVRSGSDYGISTIAPNTPQRDVLAAVLTLWGVPGDHSHDRWRGRRMGGCTQAEVGTSEECPSVAGSPKPLLTLPTTCDAPATFAIRINTWADDAFTPANLVQSHDSNGSPTPFTGCEQLGFSPALALAPDTVNADTPAGLTVEVKPRIGGLEDPEGLSTADIQNATITLPEGLVINPGQAAGLQACPPAQDGLTTDAERAAGQEDNGPPTCPAASKVGIVSIKTPLLEGAAEKELLGDVYVLQSNPPNLELLLAVSADGVNVKLVGHVHLDEAMGRLTSTFSGTPELPFTDFKLSFSGGAQAALATPTQCGTYTATSDFGSWSSPFLADVSPNADFAITSGPGGGPCPSSPLPFSPTMTAGSTTDQAGGFTNFSLLLQRGDGQQRIEKLQFKEPAGLAGLISSVPLCPEPQAAQGTCSPASHIGHAAVASGPGPFPLVLPQPGAPELPIYLTGPYKGAPFGLSIVTPVIAGPFDLGTIVTRAKIEVDPHTAQITITTDPLPQVVKGVPTDLRSINAIIDRPGFLFNPTSCTPSDFIGTATSAGGAASAPLSSHFGVGSCRELGFHPKLAVTTASKSSKTNGSNLFFKISYPKGALGTESWFNEAKFDLPKQLPARLTTIQKACLASVFEANPAACPPASLIGHAIVHTPVLPVPLAGPVYFVSHGGAKFPDAAIILQGDDVTVDLTGETFISGKTGITSATFRNTPDVPFDDIEVTIPAGPFSEFGVNLPASAHGSFCGQKLVVPTFFKAQNGLEITQNTRIGVTGCSTKLAIASHKLKRHNLTVSVFAPGAGKLKVSARGLSTASQSATGVETLTFTLHTKRRGKFKTRLRVMFTPSEGKRQTRAVSVKV